MTIHLNSEGEQLVQKELQSGRYQSAAEVVHNALRLMNERDQLQKSQREAFRKEINKGLESLRLGRGKDGEAVFDRIEAEVEALQHNDHQ